MGNNCVYDLFMDAQQMVLLRKLQFLTRTQIGKWFFHSHYDMKSKNSKVKLHKLLQMKHSTQNIILYIIEEELQT